MRFLSRVGSSLRLHSGRFRVPSGAGPAFPFAACPEPPRPGGGADASRRARRPGAAGSRRGAGTGRPPAAREVSHASRPRLPFRLRRPGVAPGPHAMSAATSVAAALGARAEEVCRRYLPHGRKHGRYWTAGDIRGARGRSLFVRLAPPGIPGQVDRRRDRGARRPPRSHPHRLRRGLAARRPLPRRAPSSPCRLPRTTIRGRCLSPMLPTATTAPKRRAACGGAAAPSTAPMPRPISGLAPSTAAGSRRSASTRRCSIATAAAFAACRRLSPP